MPTSLFRTASVRVDSSPRTVALVGHSTRCSTVLQSSLYTVVNKRQKGSIKRIRRASQRVVVASSSSTPVTDTMGGSGAARHAILHDFCMNIPYGAFMVTVGLLACVFIQGAVKFGLTAAGVGAFEIALSSLSLKTWKRGGQSTLFTVAGGVCSSVMAYVCTSLWRLGAFPWLSGIVGVASGSISLFLFYNVLSGGNPPPKNADKKD